MDVLFVSTRACVLVYMRTCVCLCKIMNVCVCVCVCVCVLTLTSHMQLYIVTRARHRERVLMGTGRGPPDYIFRAVDYESYCRCRLFVLSLQVLAFNARSAELKILNTHSQQRRMHTEVHR